MFVMWSWFAGFGLDSAQDRDCIADVFRFAVDSALGAVSGFEFVRDCHFARFNE